MRVSLKIENLAPDEFQPCTTLELNTQRTAEADGNVTCSAGTWR